MMRLVIIYSLLLTILFLFNGCLIRHGDFTVLSNKLVDVSDFELAKADRVRGNDGKDVRHWGNTDA